MLKPVFILKSTFCIILNTLMLNYYLSVLYSIPVIIIIFYVNNSIIIIIKVINMVPKNVLLQRKLLSTVFCRLLTKKNNFTNDFYLRPSPSESLLMSLYPATRQIRMTRRKRSRRQETQDEVPDILTSADHLRTLDVMTDAVMLSYILPLYRHMQLTCRISNFDI